MVLTISGWIRPALARWALALLALSAALCFVPLFNLLAFEFAFAFGLAAVALGGDLGARAGRAAEGPLPAAWARAGLQASALLSLALLPISLNALRVRNCDFPGGLLWFALLPGLSAWIASGLGVALGAQVRRPRLALAGLTLASVGLGLWRFYRHPPVDAFNLLLGYWPGALYDELIPLDDRLLASRAEDLLWAVAVVLVADGLRRGKRGLALGAILAALGGHAFALTRHVYRDAAHIQAALGGHRATAHFDVYFDRRLPAALAHRLGLELEFLHTELSAFFGAAPTPRLAAYLYPDEPTKKRLMGAGRTRIAKPWQRSLHVHGAAVGQPVLIHELAHVFSADWAAGPLHIPLHRGLVPHMPLIEGLAEAASWPADRLDLHEWSAAMRAIAVAPPLPAVLSPTGFYLRNSSTAYTLCGSFSRFYAERHGVEALRAAYGVGAFPARRFAATHAAWQDHLDGLPLPPEALAWARARFDRPSIFGKTCAHELAALRDAAARAQAADDPASALRHTLALLGHAPGDLAAHLDLIALRVALGDPPAARAAAAELLEVQPIHTLAGRRAAEWIADLDTLAGRPVALDHAGLLAGAFPRAEQRRLAAKAAAIQGGTLEILDLLSRPAPQTEVDRRLAALAADEPPLGLVAYLQARQQLSRAPAEADAHLAAALAAGLPHPSLILEAERLRAALDFDGGRFESAAARFTALAARDDLDLRAGERETLRRWARRARFFGAQVDREGAAL